MKYLKILNLLIFNIKKLKYIIELKFSIELII